MLKLKLKFKFLIPLADNVRVITLANEDRAITLASIQRLGSDRESNLY
jgi:hypothetical protein